MIDRVLRHLLRLFDKKPVSSGPRRAIGVCIGKVSQFVASVPHETL
jgi:hypothetical protein